MMHSYPRSLTSYDFLKALALVLMLIDHTGHHFYPDEMWFRVLGRLCVPIWFFLIGYARTTALPPRLWIGGVLVVLSALVAGQYLFPLDILFTIAAARALRPDLTVRATQSPENLRGWFLLLFLAAVPTGLLVEYGTMGLLFVLHGFICRNRDALKERLMLRHVRLFVFATYLTFGLQEGLLLPSLNLAQTVVLLGGLAGIAVLLNSFRPAEYPVLTQRVTRPVVFLLQIMGRRTLELYVLHILVFRGICMALYPESYAFLNWHWIPPGLVAWL
ncbi:MAG: hypothetical protein KDI61_03035 [Alphaproteobacteria bacterium]|nr:hypothetical protein [Alphaproteobacteria bacterium]MCB1839226.1 hypothetical protein [Alphaproteobacteria bacterium]